MRSFVLLRSFALSALFLSTAACPHASIAPVVAVREAQVRSDDLHLPLSTHDHEHLLKFLEAGGNRDLLEGDVDRADLNVPRRYEALLGMLSYEENLDQEDLQGPAFKAWFRKAPIRQVIDARAERPPVGNAPFAVTDGKYWWVFSREDGEKFTRLVVFQASHNPDEARGMPR
jgi:hypothetical protein